MKVILAKWYSVLNSDILAARFYAQNIAYL